MPGRSMMAHASDRRDAHSDCQPSFSTHHPYRNNHRIRRPQKIIPTASRDSDNAHNDDEGATRPESSPIRRNPKVPRHQLTESLFPLNMMSYTVNPSIATKIAMTTKSTTARTTAVLQSQKPREKTKSSTKSKPKANTSPRPLCVRDIVNIAQADGTQRLAMISEMTSFHDHARVAVVCVWLYTRADIIDDMAQHGGLRREVAKKHVRVEWPTSSSGIAPNGTSRAQFDYMLSSKRTMTVLDGSSGSSGAIKPAPDHVAAKLCRDALYHQADISERRICDVNEQASFEWLKKIL